MKSKLFLSLMALYCAFFYSPTIVVAQTWDLAGNTNILPTSFIGSPAGNSQPIRFSINGSELLQLNGFAGGRIGFGISNPLRKMTIYSTNAATWDPNSIMVGQPPAPGTTESILQISNQESGTGANDGLLLGVTSNVSYLRTVDKIRLDLQNSNAIISLQGNGRINFFSPTNFSYTGRINMIFPSADNGLYIEKPGAGFGLKLKVTSNDVEALTLMNGNTGSFIVLGSGRTGIGTNVPGADYMLDVAGKIRGCEVRVANPGWCDYVFAPEYQLMPIGALKSYLLLNRHLPEMPSETEVEKEGFDLAKMDASLLKRAEENTLYIIQLKEELATNEQKTNAQEQELESLKLKVQQLTENSVDLNEKLKALEAQMQEILKK